MIINGQRVSYKFGPMYDMDICFSDAFRMKAGGLTYEQSGSRGKLIFQLLCHAVHQLQNWKGRGWSLEKIEEVEDYEYDDASNGYVLVKREFTCARFQVKAEGRLVLTVREGVNHDYVVEYFDPVNDCWMDWMLDEAERHCMRFGRAA